MLIHADSGKTHRVQAHVIRGSHGELEYFTLSLPVEGMRTKARVHINARHCDFISGEEVEVDDTGMARIENAIRNHKINEAERKALG